MSDTTTTPEADVTPAAVIPAAFIPKTARKAVDLTTVTTISFSLTFVGVSLLLLAGFLPPAFASLTAPIDIGVLLLIVPLCALVLAMMAEVLRAAIKGTPPRRASRNATTLSEWRPGHGEG